jgi:hypothetical protein
MNKGWSNWIWPGSGRLLKHVLMLCWLLCSAACDGEHKILFIDPPINLGDYQPAYVVEGEPTLMVGYYVEQLFTPLVDGGECPVSYGVQGGTWTMPAIRTTGIDSPVKVTCTMVTEAGESISDVIAETPLYLTPEHVLEVQAFPIPVQHPPPHAANPIDDLYGQSAVLECHVEDHEGRSDTFKALVEIVED